MRNVAIAIATVISAFGTAAPAATPLSVRDSFRIGTSGTIFCSAQTIAIDKALKRHVRRRLFDHLPRCRLAGRQDVQAARKCERAGRGSPLPGRRGLLPAPDDCQRAGPRPGRDRSIASSRTPTSAIASTNPQGQARSTPPKASPDMTARSSSACAASSPTSRSRARFRSRRRARRSRGLRAGPGRNARSEQGARRSLSPQQCRQLCRSRRILRRGQRTAGDAPLSRAEAPANEALQKSNLGRYAEADALFARAAEQVGSDPIVARRLRNYRAMHLLNQGDAKGALAELDKPLPNGGYRQRRRCARPASRSMPSTAKRLNADSKIGQQLGAAIR